MKKYPSIRATLAIIRDMGLVARYNVEYREFNVNVLESADSGYFTDSRHDAIFTARAIVNRLNKGE